MQLLAGAAWANQGILLLGNDAQHLGIAGSGVASPRSAYWTYLNPAGLAALDRRLDLNLEVLIPNVEFRPRGVLGNQRDGPLGWDGVFALPTGGAVFPLRKGTLGLGIYVPAADAADYDQSRNILSRLLQGNRDRRLDYQHIRGVPGYAYPFDNGWNIGVALHTSFSRIRTDHLSSSFRPPEADFAWDSSLGAGFGLGVYKRWDRLALGASYTSPHWTQHFDDYRDLFDYPIV